MRPVPTIFVLLALTACSQWQVETRTVIPDPAPFGESDVRYADDDVQLAAALLMPAGGGPFPGAVIVQGSGDSDRTNAWSREFAEAMARRGIAVLLTDKRGSGASGGDWRTADFSDLAADALAGVRFLAGRPRVSANHVGLVGLSQGGMVVPLAADGAPDVDFVVDVSGAATTVAEQLDHEMRNTFRQAGLGPEQVEAGMHLQALATRYLRNREWEPYRAALDDALASPLAPVAKGYPSRPDAWEWDFFRGIGEYDPLPHWRALRQPVLVVYGERDELDNVPVDDSVARLHRALAGHRAPAIVRVFAGSGHALYPPDASEPGVRSDVLDLLVSKIHFFTQNEASWR